MSDFEAVNRIWEAEVSRLRARADDAEKRCAELEAERDEAQRVARVPALRIQRSDECGLDSDELCDAFGAALAYPEQKPEPREPSDLKVQL